MRGLTDEQTLQSSVDSLPGARVHRGVFDLSTKDEAAAQRFAEPHRWSPRHARPDAPDAVGVPEGSLSCAENTSALADPVAGPHVIGVDVVLEPGFENDGPSSTRGRCMHGLSMIIL
jgi:hypothetical protein